MPEKPHLIPIWFFIGVTLLAYGVLIFVAGIYEIYFPPDQPVAMAEFHAGIWWGALLALLGTLYTMRFRPGRSGSGK